MTSDDVIVGGVRCLTVEPVDLTAFRPVAAPGHPGGNPFCDASPGARSSASVSRVSVVPVPVRLTDLLDGYHPIALDFLAEEVLLPDMPDDGRTALLLDESALAVEFALSELLGDPTRMRALYLNGCRSERQKENLWRTAVGGDSEPWAGSSTIHAVESADLLRMLRMLAAERRPASPASWLLEEMKIGVSFEGAFVFDPSELTPILEDLFAELPGRHGTWIPRLPRDGERVIDVLLGDRETRLRASLTQERTWAVLRQADPFGAGRTLSDTSRVSVLCDLSREDVERMLIDASQEGTLTAAALEDQLPSALLTSGAAESIFRAVSVCPEEALMMRADDLLAHFATDDCDDDSRAAQALDRAQADAPLHATLGQPAAFVLADIGVGLRGGETRTLTSSAALVTLRACTVGRGFCHVGLPGQPHRLTSARFTSPVTLGGPRSPFEPRAAYSSP